MSSSMGNHLGSLQRRRDHLVKRVEASDASDGALGYMRAEIAALGWALEVLTDYVEGERTQARNVTRQRIEQGWRSAAGAAFRKLIDLAPDTADRIIAKAPSEITNHLFQLAHGHPLHPADDTRPVLLPTGEPIPMARH